MFNKFAMRHPAIIVVLALLVMTSPLWVSVYVGWSERAQSSSSDQSAEATTDVDRAGSTEQEVKGVHITDWLSVLFSALVALFTWRLFVATRGLQDSTEKLWKTSERALVDLERPFVFARANQAGVAVGMSMQGMALTRDVLQISIFNFGRTPARLTRIQYVTSVAPHGSIAPSIDPSRIGGRELPVGINSANGDPYVESESMCFRFSDEERDIVAGKASIWLVGFVRYDDIFSNHYITGFCQVFDKIAGRYVIRGSEHYNYARAEKSEDIPAPSSRA